MPRLPALRSDALERLAQEVRFGSPAAIRRQIQRLEELAGDLEPEQSYPEDWLLFRLTGYRVDGARPRQYLGRELLGDLSALAQRLCAAARLSEADCPSASFLTIDALAARWSVSRRTIERYGRLGLIGRRIGRGVSARQVFLLAHVEAFERKHAGLIGSAGAYSRLDQRDAARIVRRARRYHRLLGWPLTRIARRLAQRLGRSPETIRQVLLRHERTADERIFPIRARLGGAERGLAERAGLAGVPAGRIAQRLGRPAPVVRRVIDRARARWLVELGPTIRAAGGVAIDPAQATAALESAAATQGLGAPGPTDQAALLWLARRAPVPIGVVERARAEAYHALVRRAAERLPALGSSASAATALDAIETDLRWAARLKAELVRDQLGTMLRAVESVVASAGGPSIDERSGPWVRPFLLAALAATGDAVDAFEPGRGGRLAGSVVLLVTRAVTRMLREGGTPPASAARALATAPIEIPDFTRRVSPWQHRGQRRWLEPSARLRDALPMLEPQDAQVLARRFGWGPRPHRIEEIAAWLGLPPVRASVRVARAIEAGLAAGLQGRSSRRSGSTGEAGGAGR